MLSLNRVQIMGHLGGNPELRSTAAGKAMATFSVAVNQRYKTADGELRESTEWVHVVAWGSLAETVGQYLHRGSAVYVEGRLQIRQWEADHGVKHTSTQVVATAVQFLDPAPRKGRAAREPLAAGVAEDLPAG